MAGHWCRADNALGLRMHEHEPSMGGLVRSSTTAFNPALDIAAAVSNNLMDRRRVGRREDISLHVMVIFLEHCFGQCLCPSTPVRYNVLVEVDGLHLMNHVVVQQRRRQGRGLRGTFGGAR